MFERGWIKMDFIDFILVVNCLDLVFDVLQKFGVVIWDILGRQFAFVTDVRVFLVEDVELEFSDLG